MTRFGVGPDSGAYAMLPAVSPSDHRQWSLLNQVSGLRLEPERAGIELHLRAKEGLATLFRFGKAAEAFVSQ